ncbi:hypothetical protein AA0113_g9085 [Alternaria arborescens]|uniref:Uncharacterized protein n=1 Tax=Alternaria arborescens TaxID=156630 RepID=A0A4V1X304_9PLEO|nr:hypothetical protein AA0113_g9085 [Alternaria arborescens]
MQLTLTLLSSLALVTGALAVENPLTDHQIKQSDLCTTNPPLTNQGSLVVDFAKPGCTLFLYGNSKCEGDGDQIFGFVGSNVCRPIVFGARAAYKVICS